MNRKNKVLASCIRASIIEGKVFTQEEKQALYNASALIVSTLNAQADFFDYVVNQINDVYGPAKCCAEITEIADSFFEEANSVKKHINRIIQQHDPRDIPPF